MEEENITATGNFVKKKKDGVILACLLLIDYEQVITQIRKLCNNICHLGKCMLLLVTKILY